jgi:8-oxo-dGTP pyrophosphatase MutT (NUDIX family)
MFGPKVLLAAKGLITDPDGRLLLVHSLWSGAWELPGGIVNRAEQPERAVRRECREELGVEVTSARLLTVATSSAGLDTTVYFRCEVEDAPIRLSVEHTGFRFVEPAALPKYIRYLLALSEGQEPFVPNALADSSG